MVSRASPPGVERREPSSSVGGVERRPTGRRTGGGGTEAEGSEAEAEADRSSSPAASARFAPTLVSGVSDGGCLAAPAPVLGAGGPPAAHEARAMSFAERGERGVDDLRGLAVEGEAEHDEQRVHAVVAQAETSDARGDGEAGGGGGGGGAASRGARRRVRRPRALERSPRGRRRRLHRRDEVARVERRDERLGRVDEIRVAPGGRGREDLREVFPDHVLDVHRRDRHRRRVTSDADGSRDDNNRAPRSTIPERARLSTPRRTPRRRREGRRERRARPGGEGEPLRARGPMPTPPWSRTPPRADVRSEVKRRVAKPRLLKRNDVLK